MRGVRAKALRRLVKWERSAEIGVIDRELVQGRGGSAVQSPDGLRAMYLKVKNAYRGIGTQLAQAANPVVGRVRRPAPPRAYTVYNGSREGVALIVRPMRHLLAAFPATRHSDGSLEVAPTLMQARHMADRGDGAGVQSLARKFAI